MKKRFLGSFVLLVALVFLVPIAGAQVLCSSSGLKTGDALIATGIKNLCGVLIISDGNNDASIVVYDSASGATGTVLFKGTVAKAANFGGATFGNVVRTTKGIYADMTGTGASYIIYYVK
jgi:predicted ribonuclease toxin of YeeF-YezG toxin-antitoxin module